jgi:SWI/SNF-related matrix-associated actin-dependent regulator of chromatin subfamily A3
VRIFLEGAKKPIAIIVSDVLPRLVRDFAVTINATLCGKNVTSLATKAVEEPSAEKIVRASFCSLRIIIYGFLGQMGDVADLLSKGDLFLQHPSVTEVDREVKYVNPQYLLAPGEDMPPIEKLSISTCCSGRRSAPSGDSLGECEKNQVLKIFDTASELTRDVGTIEPSSRLVTKLKRYSILIEAKRSYTDSIMLGIKRRRLL